MHKHFVVRDVVGQCQASTAAMVGEPFDVAWLQGDHEGALNSRIRLTWTGDGAGAAVGGERRPGPVLEPHALKYSSRDPDIGASTETWGDPQRWDAFVDAQPPVRGHAQVRPPGRDGPAEQQLGHQCVTLNGAVYLAHNPTSGNWAARAPLLVPRSRDDGATWQPWTVLESSLGAADGASDFSHLL